MLKLKLLHRICSTNGAWMLLALIISTTAPMSLGSELDSNATTVETRTTGVFQANEAMIIKVPLDTTSVLNGAFSIDSAGYANLPIIGRMYVNGKTTETVETYLGQKMASYLRDTHIMATPVIRLTLLGLWQKPGMLYVGSEASVWDACRLAGGPGSEVNLFKWRVMRGKQVLSISLLDEFSRGTSLRRAGVRSGDIFVIPIPNPQAGFWYWFRESLTITAQVAAITTTGLTAYLTYLAVNGR